MAVICEVVTFSTRTGSVGTQTVSLSKFSSTEMPKAVIFLSSNSGSSTGNNAYLCAGLATSDGGQTSAMTLCKHNTNNGTTGEVGLYGWTGASLYLADHSSSYGVTTEVWAGVTTWAASGLTLTYGAVATARTVTAIVLGGSDTQWKMLNSAQTGSTGNRAITGAGFQPNIGFTFPVLPATGSGDYWSLPGMGIGVIDSDGLAICTGRRSTWDGGLKRILADGFCFVGLNSSAGFSGKQAFVSWDSDGLTINDSVSNTHNNVQYLVGRLTNGRAELDLTSHSSTGDKTQSVTTGYTPVGLVGLSVGKASSSSVDTTRAGEAVGVADFTTASTHTICLSGTSPSASSCGFRSGAAAIITQNEYNTLNHRLNVVSAASGSYTLNASTAGTVHVGILAILSQPPAATACYWPAGYGHGCSGKGLSYQKLNPATQSTLPAVSDANAVVLAAEVADVRMTDDGSDPSVGGMLISFGGPPVTYRGRLDVLRFAAASPGAMLNVLYRCI